MTRFESVPSADALASSSKAITVRLRGRNFFGVAADGIISLKTGLVCVEDRVIVVAPEAGADFWRFNDRWYRGSS